MFTVQDTYVEAAVNTNVPYHCWAFTAEHLSHEV